MTTDDRKFYAALGEIVDGALLAGCDSRGLCAALDAVAAILDEHARWRDLVEGLANQFAYPRDDPPRLSTGGLSDLEAAFDALGWDDPHRCEWRDCEIPGCTTMANCGTPTPDGGYVRCCFRHYSEINRARG